jgi:hypothetical protein
VKRQGIMPTGGRGGGTHLTMRPGYCDTTSAGFRASCETDDKGNFPMPSPKPSTWSELKRHCAAECMKCERCNFLSMSHDWLDCSWFATCPETLLKKVAGFHTTQMRDVEGGATQSPPPSLLLPPGAPSWCTLAHEARRPVIVGVLGNSFAWGAHMPGVALQDRRAAAWPARLHHVLRERIGPSVHVINAAVRASAASFAHLCWDEIWGDAWSWFGHPRAPRLDLAIVDYTLTSTVDELEELHDFLSWQGVPQYALLYCGLKDKSRLRREGMSYEVRRARLGDACKAKHADYLHVLASRHVPYRLIGPGLLRRSGSKGVRTADDALATTLKSIDGSELNAFGHQTLAADVASALSDRCGQLVPSRPKQGRTPQLCRFGFHVEEFVVPGSNRGFERHDPGSGRTPGLLARSVGASVAIGFRSPTLREGYVSVGYEQGWRNRGIAGLLTCRAPCTCAPQLLNLSHGNAKTTLNVLSTPVWVRAPCVVEVRVIAPAGDGVAPAGRLFLTSATMASVAPSADTDLQLEISDVAARGFHANASTRRD